MLGPQRGTLGGLAAHEQAEAIGALRKASAMDADPQRDMSLYNLALLLGDDDHSRKEADEILEGLMRSSSFYRRTWYLRLERGSVRYRIGHALQDAGDIPAARREWAAAAKLYSAAIRARPRFRFFYQDGPRIHVLKRWTIPPIMYANAKDAHAGAAHRARAWWYERRFNRARSRMIKVGEKYYERGEWEPAYAYFDWALVGRWDETEIIARTIKNVVTLQLGKADQAEREWAETVNRAPSALVARAAIWERDRQRLPAGLPGDQPTDPPAVAELVRRLQGNS
jgi:tetratricopeptide (TPR) repeat protein